MAEQAGGPKLSADRISVAFAAQQGATPAGMKRFFKAAHVEEQGGSFAILFDERPAKTPARRPLVLPTKAAAELVADEWNAVGDVIDPTKMPLTRIVNVAIDGVAERMDAVLGEVVSYAAADLILYRASEPEQLVADQARAWDPILAWFKRRYGACFILAEGLMHVAQPASTLVAVEQALTEAVGDAPGAPFRLAALNVMTTLTGSALLALAVMRNHLAAEDAWSAAHVDEAFQESRWGQDAEAMDRRAKRWQEMQAAAVLGTLV